MKTSQIKHAAFKKEISFVDALSNKAEIEIELTHRNGYDELCFSGTYEGAGGQIVDRINPANDAQETLVKLWNQYHLNGMFSGKSKKLPTNITTLITLCVSNIEAEEKERKGEQYLKDMPEHEALELIEDETGNTGRDAETILALAIMENLTVAEIGDIEIDGHRATVQGTDYLAGTDEEMDEDWDADLENYIEECIIGNMEKGVRETVGRYFDNEAWKSDARQDGRAHSLNRYDGGEYSTTVNGTTYYAYRQ